MAAETKVKTSVQELPESRVRVDAEVPAEEVRRRMQAAAGRLGRDLRFPGFRRGKVPAPVVIQRVGRAAVLDEAVRESMGRWYTQALDDSGIVPVGDPHIDLGGLPEDGEPLTFHFEIGVRPKARLGDYEGLEVGRREPAVDDAAVDEQLDTLRQQLGRLETVERAAAQGDFVVMDYAGSIDDVPFEGGEGRDQLLELGSGQLIPGFEEQLVGAAAGEERTVTVTFPEDYPQAEHLAGREAAFAVTVKEVKAKQLPELDDDFATEAGGFDTLEELREDIASRLREADERRAEAEYREAVLDAVVDASTVDVPDALVEARAGELWHNMLHTLSHRGISKDAYLSISGRTEEELLEEAKPDAERALKREAVLAAVIEAEAIEPSDGDVLDALQQPALQQGMTPEKLRRQLERSGRLDDVRADLAQRRAVELLAEKATPIPLEQAAAREKLWTPGKEEAGAAGEEPAEGAGRIWTPGS